jgi:hypothetical protein
MSLPTVYQIDDQAIRKARTAIESGIEYLNMCRAEHEQNLGRTTLKNRMWAERMDSDLNDMIAILDLLPKSK